MRSHGRTCWWVGALALALAGGILPACSSDDSGDDGGGTSAASEEASADLSDDEQAIVDAAQAWIDDEAELDDDVKDELQFTDLATNPNVSNVTFTQFIDDHRVVGGELVVHVLEDGSVQGASNAIVEAEPGDDVDPIDQAEAEDNASKAVDGTPDEVGPTELVWYQEGHELLLSYAVDVTTTDPEGQFRVLINAGTGDVITLADAMTDRRSRSRHVPWSSKRTGLTALPASVRLQAGGDACDPGPAPSACLYIPDPIYANGGDPPDVADADGVLQGRELANLDNEDGHLTGDFVDTEGAANDVEPDVEEDQTWAAGRANPGFEAAMAYYWVDRAHALLDSVGFGDVWGEPIPVEAVDSETVDNAFWDGQAIHLGVGSDGINEGEDASGIVHEYGHAVLDWQNEALFDSPEGGAYHEGWGDLLALLVTLDDRTGDVGCLFPWTESLECLRRLDTDLVYPDDLVNEVHGDGMIYTGAIWDIVEGLLDSEGLTIDDCPGTTDCDEVRDRVLETLLTSHGYLVSGTTLPDVAAAFGQANDAVTGGEDADLIDEAFTAHGLTGGGGSTMDPDGGFEPEEGVPSVGFEITHTYRGDLDVVVGVADSSGEDLCEPISLHAPDPNDAEDNLTGIVDVSESECADLLPPSGEQQWYLRAVDTLAADTGEIHSFTVYDGTDPYEAPGLPLPIADNDPAGTTAIVDGSGEDSDNPDLPDDDSDMDGPSFDIEITHSYVGDLSIEAGTADNEGGNIVCSVDVLDPDPGNAGDGGLSGTIDMSDCADSFPPSDETRWFVRVIDTAAVDEGTVDSLTLNGPDGESIEFTDLPVDIPDNDPDGVVLLTDGERAQPTSSPGGDAGHVDITVDHPYAGDLSVEIGAVDDNDNLLCQESLATPDIQNNAVGLTIDQDLDDCAQYFPPQDGVRFYLFVADTLEEDQGQLTEATITGPDGESFQTDTGTIPDADPEGVTTFFQPV